MCGVPVPFISFVINSTLVSYVHESSVYKEVKPNLMLHINTYFGFSDKSIIFLSFSTLWHIHAYKQSFFFHLCCEMWQLRTEPLANISGKSLAVILDSVQLFQRLSLRHHHLQFVPFTGVVVHSSVCITSINIKRII